MIATPTAAAGRRPQRAGWPFRALVLGTAGAGLGIAAHLGAAGHGVSPLGAALAFGTATAAGLVPARGRGVLATAVSAMTTQVVAHVVMHLSGHPMPMGEAESAGAMPGMTGMNPMPGMHGTHGMNAMPGMTGMTGMAPHHQGILASASGHGSATTGLMHHAVAAPAPHGLLGGAVHALADTLGLSGMLLGHVLAALLAALVLSLAEAALLAAVTVSAGARAWWAALACPPLAVPARRLSLPADPHPSRLPAAPGRPGQLRRRGPPRPGRPAVA